MVMNRAHFEYSFPCGFKGNNLDNNRQGFQHEDQSQEDQEQFCTGHDGNTRNGTAQGKGTGVPHENFRWVVVEEQKANAATCQNNDEIAQVIESGHVALHRVSRQGNHAAPRCQAVQTVSQIDCIGRPYDNQHNEGIVEPSDGNIHLGEWNGNGIG